MTTVNKLDCPYEVKVEFVDTDDTNTITPKNEGEITIDVELLHKENFVVITNYEDLIVEAPRLCSLCDGIFPNSYSFLQHNLQHLILKLDKCDEYSCKTCSGKFSTHHDLENHKIGCILYDYNNKSICPIYKQES
ncbi:unnamed protein product [Colias eurytheme]|nr:unnamed protein product [Colias eurytheme]